MKPLSQRTANELKRLASGKCKHGHTFLEHYSCYQEIEGERIGFLDIETSQLTGDWGRIICYCIKDNDSKKIYSDRINKKDIRTWHRKGNEDKRVLQSLIEDMKHFDRFVGHYQTRFDLPMIRTRAVICGLRYPQWGAYVKTDTWDILRSKFKLSRNSLENSTRQLIGETRKDHLTSAILNDCLRGEEWALNYTLSHCKKDVLDTQDLYRKIVPFIKETNSSI